MSENRHYALAIIGGGPAGCSAAMYAARNGVRCCILEALTPGGQLLTAGEIRNYPGTGSIQAPELAERFRRDGVESGAEIRNARVHSAALTGRIKRLDTDLGLFTADAVILATGATPRKLDLPGEERLLGRGISYCAHCDGPLYRGKQVAVVGGGNTAVSQAIALSRLCSRVTILLRREHFRASRELLNQLEALPNVTVRRETAVTALRGEETLAGVTLSGGEFLPCDGLFVAIGRLPDTGYAAGQLETDSEGYVITDRHCRTNLPGVFAAGDLRSGSLRQIITAAADGAIAGSMAAEYIGNLS